MCHFNAKLFTKAAEAKKRFSSCSLSRSGEKPRAPGTVHIRWCPIFAAGVSRSPHQTVGLPSTAFWGLGSGVRRGGLGGRIKWQASTCTGCVFHPLFMGGWLGPLIPHRVSHQVGNACRPCLHLHKGFGSFLRHRVMVRCGRWEESGLT